MSELLAKLNHYLTLYRPNSFFVNFCSYSLPTHRRGAKRKYNYFVDDPFLKRT